MKGRMLYVTLQATVEGQAAHVHVHRIVEGLRELGWEIDLFEPDGRASRGILSRLASLLALQLRAARMLPRTDLLYLRAHTVAYPLAMLARLLRVPVVQEVNGSFEDQFAAWPSVRPLRALIVPTVRSQYRSADGLIVVTPGMKAFVDGEARRNDAVVIPNAADEARFTPSAVPQAGLPGRYVALVGSLAPWQGVDLLLEAVKDRAWPQDVNVAIAGDGTKRGAVESAASADSRVRYLGRLSHDAVPGFLAGALASAVLTTEVGPIGAMASPVKLFESMSCGTPIIVSEAAGPSAVVRRYQCGVVVPSTPQALAEAVARLAADPSAAEEMGAKGRAAILTENTWRHRAEATSALLGEVLEARR